MHILKVETLLSSTSSSFHLLLSLPYIPHFWPWQPCLFANLSMGSPTGLVRWPRGRYGKLLDSLGHGAPTAYTTWRFCSSCPTTTCAAHGACGHGSRGQLRAWAIAWADRGCAGTTSVDHDGDVAPVTWPWLTRTLIWEKNRWGPSYNDTVRIYGWHVVHGPTNSPCVCLNW